MCDGSALAAFINSPPELTMRWFEFLVPAVKREDRGLLQLVLA
jgi:hypothetical protein